MEKTFFGIFGLMVQNTVRWIILFGRRYQIVPALYLVVFFVGIIGYGNKPVNLPPPAASVPTPAQVAPTPTVSPVPTVPTNTPTISPTPSDNTNTSNPPASDTSDSAITVAKPKAYKTGDTLTVRFDRKVSNVSLSVDNAPVAIDCEQKICKAFLPKEAATAQVYWNQKQENFSLEFRL
jgi:flagellar basal body L-ring protein FlgH